MLEQTDDVKKNSSEVVFGHHPLSIASLEDVLASKRAAAREKDKATIPVLEMTLDEKRRQQDN